jgi:hypothetical protein
MESLIKSLIFPSEMVLCPVGSYVYGMRLKVEFDQGTFDDDSALNAVDLLCINPMKERPQTNASIAQFEVITSSEGHKGVHGIIMECPAPGFAIGFEFRSEPNQILDDSAGNNLNLYCSDGSKLEGYGMGWGEWTPPLICPRGLRLCSIQTLIEGPSKLFQSEGNLNFRESYSFLKHFLYITHLADDDTSLNNVNMGCCA